MKGCEICIFAMFIHVMQFTGQISNNDRNAARGVNADLNCVCNWGSAAREGCAEPHVLPDGRVGCHLEGDSPGQF